jgi:hypothetical protein
MVLTAHAIAGAAAANLIPDSPAVGLFLGYLSHYILDIIPHTEYDISGIDDKEAKSFRSVFHDTKSFLNLVVIGIDFMIGLTLSIFLFARDLQSLIATIAGVIGGVLPDALQYLYYRTKKWPWTIFQKFHDAFHYEENPKAGLVEGIRNQIFSIAVVLALFFALT